MATAQGVALLEANRQAQGQLAQAMAQDYLLLWPLLTEKGQVDRNTPRWLQYVTAAIARRRQQSATLAAQYMSAYRLAEVGAVTDGFTVMPSLDMPLDAVTTSLMVLGPTAYKREVARQLRVEQRDLTDGLLTDNRLSPGLQNKIAANSARAAIRHAQNGARDTIDTVTKGDQRVVGYVRTVGAHPCFFCAMLASRGPVYEGDSFDDSDPRFHGPGNAKIHDGCACMLMPLYSRENPDFLKKVREYEDLWKRTGNLQRFREAYEGRAS